MAEFKSYRSFWDFYHSATREFRYMRSPEQSEFLAAVLETSKSRRVDIPQGRLFWRAQAGCLTEFEDLGDEACEYSYPYPAERMKPLKGQASEGRANPKGIPYLYMATDMNTAVAEVRPWIGVTVSVARLETARPLTIVNCTSGERRLLVYDGEPVPAQREVEVWHDVDYAFSRPVTNNDLAADYVPTQIVAESFRAAGIDGVGYRSSLGPGHNVAIFDLDAAHVVDRAVVRVESIRFTVSEPEPRM